MMLLKKLQQLIGVSKGNPVAVVQTADAASGGHLTEFFKTSSERLEEAITTEVRDGFLEMAKIVEYNGTALKLVVEILDRLVSDQERAETLKDAWRDRDDPPDLRDMFVGASAVAPAYATSTAPLRRLYITALRGSYAPEIFTFGFGPGLLKAMINSEVIPEDLDVLDTLATYGDKDLRLDTPSDALESYERLAAGGFVELMQNVHGAPHFILKRTEALMLAVKVRITPKGRRLRVMIKRGRGETVADESRASGQS